MGRGVRMLQRTVSNSIHGHSVPGERRSPTARSLLLMVAGSCAQVIAQQWADHQITMNMVRDILMYMVSDALPGRSGMR
jgi:hypothetical protein